MNDFWVKLSERERWMLIAGGLIFILYLVYVFAVAPLSRAVDKHVADVREKQQLLVWMEQVRSKARLHKAPEHLDKAKLLGAFSTSLSQTPLHTFTHQLQQTGEGELQLSFEEVPYNACISWLFSLRNKYAFSIKQLSFKQTKTAGVVNAVIVVVTD